MVYLSPDLEQKQALKLRDIVVRHQVSGIIKEIGKYIQYTLDTSDGHLEELCSQVLKQN